MIFEKRDDEIFQGLATINAEVSDAITIGTFKATGRGVKATRDIRKGEIIMTVRDVITARFIIEECLDVRFMLDTMRFGPKIDVQDLMVLWVLTEEEKGRTSKYYGYINSLPLRSTSPYAVHPREWEKLPIQLKRELNEEYGDIEGRYLTFKKVLRTSHVPTINDQSFEKYLWAFWVIRSRWVSVYDYRFPDLNRGWLKGSQHDSGSLCPWFDMMNHSEDPSVRYDFKADHGMVLRATDDISEGSELLISYTSRSDDELIADYGFCLPPGENEESCIILCLIDFQDLMVDRLYVNLKLIQNVAESVSFHSDKKIFQMYEKGIAYELECFINELLARRDEKYIGGEIQLLQRKIETLQFILMILQDRLTELDDLDGSGPADDRNFNMVAKSLRNSHRHIISTSISTYSSQIKQMKLTISENCKR